MLEFKIGQVKICFYFGFFAAVIFYFYATNSDSLGIAAALTSCILHEMGHLFAMCALSLPPEKICFYAGGIKILPCRRLESRVTEALILVAGSGVNFILAAVSVLCGFDLLVRINLALGVFNLLPFSFFDGGRLVMLFAGENLRRALLLILIPLIALIFVFGKISFTVAAVFLFVGFAEIFVNA